MNKSVIIWGFALWLIGYILGMLLFFVVPVGYIGWVITPIGIAMTVWVLWKKIPLPSLQQSLLVAGIWTLIAIVGDYLFLLQLLHPADGYYKLDVYIYYLTTFLLPLLVGYLKKRDV